jgi:hypothetical protein
VSPRRRPRQDHVCAKGEDETLTRAQIASEAVTLFVGGTHRTGNTFHLLFANLARNPQYLRRVVEEINSKLPPLSVDEAAYPVPGLEEKLDFVNAALRETHRKDPVGTFNMPRTVPEDGFQVAGFEFLNTEEPMKVVCHANSELRTPIIGRCKRRGEPFRGLATLHGQRTAARSTLRLETILRS